MPTRTLTKPKLTVTSIPKSTWGKNAYHLLPKDEWDRIRRMVYQRAGYECEACGATDVQLHCHEEWEWDLDTKVQSLRELIALCPLCHEVKHWGRTIKVTSRAKHHAKHVEMIYHLCTVNDWYEEDVMDHLSEVNKSMRAHYAIQWTINMDLLEQFAEPDTKFVIGGFEL